MNDPYARIIRYYDAENADLVEDLGAYEHLADRFGGPVLDVGCGTGRVVLHLAKHGVSATGIDPSEAMLERARAALEGGEVHGSRVTLLRGNARDFEAEGSYRLAVLAYGTFEHVRTQEEQLAALENVARHLEPGGGIAIDVSNPVELFRAEDVASLVLERTFRDPETGSPVAQQSYLRVDRARQVKEVTWLYDRASPGGPVHRTTVEMRLHYYTVPEMRLLLERAGFGGVEHYGDYRLGEFTEESPRLFVVATRDGR